jgi:5'-methylthioadenosine phosphorylase
VIDQGVAIGVIGGSGLYDLPGAEVLSELQIQTPYGPPSGPVTVVRLGGGYEVAFLARHGRGHRLAPHEVPNRANIWALKTVGVRRIVAVNAVGSLTQDYVPGDLVLPSDVVDRTSGRPSTFFEQGLVAHVSLAEPMCRTVRSDLLSAKALTSAALHHGGTLVVIQGPRFSTKAESTASRAQGFALVGMTTMPEAVLAREAEICYATLAMVTDFDVWHDREEQVSAETILERLDTMAGAARALFVGALPALAARGGCECHDALRRAFVSDLGRVDPLVKERLAPIIGRYLS